MKKWTYLAAPVIICAAFLAQLSARGGAKPAAIEELGKRLFFDTNLSSPAGQSCAACHGPSTGFTGPDERINETGGVYEGALRGRFGNRKPPAAAYGGWSPRLHRAEGEFVGSLFWDGRATGDILGDPLADQAMGPFLNPLEQNLPDAASVVRAVRGSDYADLFRQVFGPGSLDADEDPDRIFGNICRAIAAYERSAEVNPFSSKFDDFWRAATAKGLEVDEIGETGARDFKGFGLDDRELEGLVLFASKGKCAECHVLTPAAEGLPPVFADYKYDNLGIPRNPENPFYGQDKAFNPDGRAWVDKGLGGFLETIDATKAYAADNVGKHRTPTLRNVDARPSPGFVKAYTHNGFFKSLKEVVRFYNTRDVVGAGWPAPEVAENLNNEEMGDLGLTGDEEDAIVDFMKTLTDRR
ncbi:MAG TPA: cytochrome C [Candidatus Aminicenantes bacterium]|nr:cytochrome C [Candidatus Aminicenantes bacterium]